MKANTSIWDMLNAHLKQSTGLRKFWICWVNENLFLEIGNQSVDIKKEIYFALLWKGIFELGQDECANTYKQLHWFPSG